jgi:RNA polymerase sigma-70 factor (ECF subfamily)
MKTATLEKKGSESGRLSETREQQLMGEIVGGSEVAFQKLATGLRPLMISVVSRTLGSANEVDDVCQTVLLAVWNGASGWEPAKGRVSTWVATIARNRAIDHVRKASRAAAMRERLSTENSVLAPVSFAPTADDDLVRLEARRATRRALRELAPEQRQVLELAYLEGLTQVEVAERTGLPLGTAKARIRRGMMSLRRRMMSLRRRLPQRLAA